MGKKAKSRRKERYKMFMEGMRRYREKFIEKKLKLIEKILTDESLKNELMNKDRKKLNILERAAIDTIITRDIKNIDQFNEMKDVIKEKALKKAKFKYTPKKI